MKTIIEKLCKAWADAEKELRNEIEKLDNYGDECDCDEPETTLLIHTGKWPELLNTCLSCAGCVDL